MIENKAPIVSGKPRLEEDVYDTKRGGPGQDIYNKGSLVMHTLRGLIGDDAFFRAVREEVYGTPDPRPGNFTPRYGTTPEFMAIVKRASGRDLDWFFQAYLYQKATARPAPSPAAKPPAPARKPCSMSRQAGAKMGKQCA
jgi:aminopeptidase N